MKTRVAKVNKRRQLAVCGLSLFGCDTLIKCAADFRGLAKFRSHT